MIVTNEKETLRAFHIHLLNIILLTTAGYTFFKATASIWSVFPLTEYYRYTLFAYSFTTLSCYFLLKSNKNHFELSAKIATLASVVDFSVMAYSSTFDEFRLVWFFFTSVAAFMFLGKRYGVFITLLIVFIIITMHFTIGIGFSGHAVATFVTSMLIFDIFFFSFFNKLE